jgi:NADPH:quinone reductase-like Zn-dependent oxidoreductase
VLRGRPLEEKIALTQRFGREVLPLFDQGVLRPIIDSRFPLAQAAEAHRRVEANATVGKVLLDVEQ